MPATARLVSSLSLVLAPVLLGAQTPGQGRAPAQTGPQPPPDSPPVVRTIELSFPAQGNVSVIDPQTYLYYIQTRPSRPSEAAWVPYDEETVLADFDRLWATSFLDDLSIDVRDVPYPNGVVGKHITYRLEERQRVKVVDFLGSDQLDFTEIDEALVEANAQIRLDSFIDQGRVRRVEGVIRDLLAEEGYMDATVGHELTELAGGPKLVNLTFQIEDGPKFKIREIAFIGNEAMSDGELRGEMSQNKQPGLFSFITGGGTYKELAFAEDAENIRTHYRNHGYIAAQVGQPTTETLETSDDGETRWIRLSIPVTEGERYRIGRFGFNGNTVVQSEQLRPLFDVDEGDFYSEEDIREGIEKVQELYGTGGYFEFFAFPDLQPRDSTQVADALAEPEPEGNGDGTAADEVGMIGEEPIGGDLPLEVEEEVAVQPAASRAEPTDAPLVDVTIQVEENEQFFVHRIEFRGNTVTRDHVVRRELRLHEGGILNLEALKYSVRRLNQLGYFKPLEDENSVQIEKTENETNQVDVTLNLEEQNRNQLTFGAGVSQFEGVFGQLSFQTSNFMGRGETLTLALQAGSRSQNYQLAFTEPFLAGRPISSGFDIYKRELRYLGQFTQGSAGGNVAFGFPLADFTRAFLTYGFEQVTVKDLNPFYLDENVIARNPFLRDALLISEGGNRTISRITPSVVLNSVDHPIFPTTGDRITASFEYAGPGGNTYFVKPSFEAVTFMQHTPRTSIGLRAQVEYIRPYGSTQVLPIFERLFLGGEYSVRGYDIRTIGPSDSVSGLVIGGNKSLLFNAEYLITIGGPVRLVLFYDAGQVRDEGEDFLLNEFKTSTGAEVRFFMPVLNVPFRLIFAYNPNREGVLDYDFEPAKAFTFRFAVGSTF